MSKRFLFWIVSMVTVLFVSCNRMEEVAEDDPESLNIEGMEELSDYEYSATGAATIEFSGSTVKVSGSGVSAQGAVATISEKGTYLVSGTTANGQLVVKTSDTDAVKLVLNGVSLTNSATSPLFIDKAVKVILILPKGTTNTFTDGAIYTEIAEGQNAAIYSQSYLSVFGEGTLDVNGNFEDGITGKDGLVIKSGNLIVKAVDDAVRGKDYLHIYDGNFNLTSGGDGMTSNDINSENTGIIIIENGIFNISAGGDGITASKTLTVKSGAFTITSGGGSSKTASALTSAKAVKAAGAISLNGDFSLSAAEDAIHSDTDVTISGGTYNLSAADDGIHATNNVTISNADISITKSEEGIEGKFLTYNSGTIKVVSNDDSSNSTNGKRTEANDGSHTYINGGTLILSSANGDPLDSNGNITMKGGTVIIHGPKQSPEVALDFNGTFNLDGGVLVASGTNSNMTQFPSSSSAQKSVGIKFSSAQTNTTLFSILDDSGITLVTFLPERNFYSMIYSSPAFESGKTYHIYTGGASTGTNSNGFFTGGEYKGGTLKKSFTISGTVTSVTGL